MRGLNELAGSTQADRFDAAARQRAATIGEAGFAPFRSALTAMPATDEGLAELDLALSQIEAPISRLDPPLRDRYVDAVAQRRDAIVKAVAKEDARLATLPLAGGVFVDRGVNARFELRDAKRLYMTVFDQTTEAGYELDRDRLIVRLPTGNQVFARQGAWIRGYDLNLKREATQ